MFDVEVREGGSCVIDIVKHSSGRLDLGLVLDPIGTIQMLDFPHPDRPDGTDGVRSAYTLRTPASDHAERV